MCHRFDVHDRKLVAGEFEECGLTHFIRGLDVDVPERRVNLKFGRNDKTLGFNVRGGKEYGLGIYISKYAIICICNVSPIPRTQRLKLPN